MKNILINFFTISNISFYFHQQSTYLPLLHCKNLFKILRQICSGDFLKSECSSVSKIHLFITDIASAIRCWKHRSRKISEVMQLGPQVALGWVTILGLAVNAIHSYKYCKIPEAEKRGLHNMFLRQKKKKKKFI